MKLTLQNRYLEASDVESYIFKPQEPLVCQAGQFLHYVLHHEPTDERGSDRWFTNAAAPNENEVRITTRLTADKGSSFKLALQSMKVGEEIEISDVGGDFVVDDLAKEYVFIAGGIGVTPFRSILKELDHLGKRINATLLYSNRNEDFPYKKEFDEFAMRNADLKIHYLVSPERIDETNVRKFVPDLQKPIFYVSGPEPMVESLGTMLEGMGIPKNHIKQDFFPNYPAE